MAFPEPAPPMFILAIAGLAAHRFYGDHHDVVFVSGHGQDQGHGYGQDPGHGHGHEHKPLILIPKSVEVTWDPLTGKGANLRKSEKEDARFYTFDPSGYRLIVKADGTQKKARVSRLGESEESRAKPRDDHDPAAWQSIDWLLPLDWMYPKLERGGDSKQITCEIRLTAGDVVCEAASGKKNRFKTYPYDLTTLDEEPRRLRKFVPEWVVNRFNLKARDEKVIIEFFDLRKGADKPDVTLKLWDKEFRTGTGISIAAVNRSSYEMEDQDITKHIDLYRTSLFKDGRQVHVRVREHQGIFVETLETPYRQALSRLIDGVAPWFPSIHLTEAGSSVGCPQSRDGGG